MIHVTARLRAVSFVVVVVVVVVVIVVIHRHFLENSLTKHRICHSTEKPFACSTCKRSFSRRGDLNVHFRKHTNKRDFKCNLCDKSFLRNSHLESHQKLHTKILTCVKCGIKFNEFSELVQHRVDCAFKPIDKVESFYIREKCNTHSRYLTTRWDTLAGQGM